MQPKLERTRDSLLPWMAKHPDRSSEPLTMRHMSSPGRREIQTEAQTALLVPARTRGGANRQCSGLRQVLCIQFFIFPQN